MPVRQGAFRDSAYLSRDGKILPGVKRTVIVPAPSAGNDWRAVVPPGVQWRVCSAYAQLTTAIAAGNRFVGSIITDGNLTVYRATPVSAQAASSVNVGYTFVPSNAVVMPSGQSSQNLVAVPDCWLPSGFTIGASTDAIAAADQWTFAAVWVEEVFVNDSRLSTDLYAAEDLEAQTIRTGA